MHGLRFKNACSVSVCTGQVRGGPQTACTYVPDAARDPEDVWHTT